MKRLFDNNRTIKIEFRLFLPESYIESARLINEGVLEDTQALADWIDFVNNIQNNAKKNPNLRLVSKKGGKIRKDLCEDIPMSYYFYFEIVDDSGNCIDNLYLDLRVSTHPLKSKTARASHEDSVRDEISNLSAEFIQKDIIVNNKTFKSYWNALFASFGVISSVVETVTHKKLK